MKIHRIPSDIEKCPICLDDCDDPKILSKCGHVFCRNCIDQYFEKVKPQCPCCSMIYGEIRGEIFRFIFKVKLSFDMESIRF